MKLRVARRAVGDLKLIWAHVAAEKCVETAERLVTFGALEANKISSGNPA